MNTSFNRRDFFKKMIGIAAITTAGASAPVSRALGSRPAVEAISEEAIKNHKQSVQSQLFQSILQTARSASARSRR